MAASAAYGLYQLAQSGHDLKCGVVEVMVAAHVAANSLQWVAGPVAMLEKQLELLQARPIDYVQVVQAAVHKIILELRDSLVL